jgi:hypothetical protein
MSEMLCAVQRLMEQCEAARWMCQWCHTQWCSLQSHSVWRCSQQPRDALWCTRWSRRASGCAMQEHSQAWSRQLSMRQCSTRQCRVWWTGVAHNGIAGTVGSNGACSRVVGAAPSAAVWRAARVAMLDSAADAACCKVYKADQGNAVPGSCRSNGVVLESITRADGGACGSGEVGIDPMKPAYARSCWMPFGYPLSALFTEPHISYR